MEKKKSKKKKAEEIDLEDPRYQGVLFTYASLGLVRPEKFGRPNSNPSAQSMSV